MTPREHSDSASSRCRENPAPLHSRHDRRNEVHAIWLGIRLIEEQIQSRSWQDAKLTVEALRESADRLKQMERQEWPEQG